MKRGRKPGQGSFAGGRPKAAPNKAGAFDAKLPAIRCDVELKEFYEEQAKAAGLKLSDCIRKTLEDNMKESIVVNKNGIREST